jgi:AcrR family transcriptional regulator
MTRATYHHGDLERALVRAALEIMRDKGRELTLREVARAVGVNHTAVYRHFEDKRALLAAIAERGFAALADRMKRALAPLPDREHAERLLVLGQEYVRFALEHPSHFEVMSGPRINEDGRSASLEAAIDEAFAIVTREIDAGVARGELRAAGARDQAVALWTMAHGIASLVAAKRLPVRSTRVAVSYARTLMEPLVRGLGRSAEPPPFAPAGRRPPRAPSAGRGRGRTRP